MKTTILLCALIVALNSCDKADNPIKNNDSIPPGYIPVHPEFTLFAEDTLDSKVSFDKNDLINKKWQVEMYHYLSEGGSFGPASAFSGIDQYFTLTFYDNDSVAGISDSAYFGEYSVTENGGIAVSKWNGTTSESPWESKFNGVFPHVRNFYTKDSVLMLFTDSGIIKFNNGVTADASDYKIKLIQVATE